MTTDQFKNIVHWEAREWRLARSIHDTEMRSGDKIDELLEAYAQELVCPHCATGDVPIGHLYHLIDEPVGRFACLNCICGDCMDRRKSTETVHMPPSAPPQPPRK